MKNLIAKAAIASFATTLGVTAIALDPAQATTFGLGGSFDLESSFLYEEDGIGLTVTGVSQDGPRDVVRSGLGLGVYGGGGDDFEVDGFGPNEGLKFLFDHTVSLVSATFSRVGFNDDFTLFVDGSIIGSADIPGGSFFDNDFGTFFFPQASFNEGNEFIFAATGFNDDFKLKRLKIEKVVDVPEPAAMLGLGAVAAGLLAQKRSRKETA
ncbi:MAG: PEP-CTERM sorting domain-containing protein [Leptolyngbyaceae cyanobacterium]